MVFTKPCSWCREPATFHDDERDEMLLFCVPCQGKYNEMKLINDAADGDLALPEDYSEIGWNG